MTYVIWLGIVSTILCFSSLTLTLYSDSPCFAIIIILAVAMCVIGLLILDIDTHNSISCNILDYCKYTYRKRQENIKERIYEEEKYKLAKENIVEECNIILGRKN